MPDTPPLYFHLQTFGCKSNQYESQGIRELLIAAGHVEVDAPGSADLYVVNSCGVTSRASASCRNAVRKALRANPGVRVVLTGCGVDLDEAWPDIPSGPPLLVPNAQKHALPELVASWLKATANGHRPRADRFGLAISAFDGHTRAFLKIQDGCDNHCAYCAVPRARGAPESRPAAEILAEAERLTANGHGEIVLTGINIGVYRHGGMDFSDIVSAIARTPGLVRLRLGSVEPPQVTERLAEVMAKQMDNICPHLHMPLQSGDDGVLARMGRRYGAGEFLDKIALLRRHLPNPAVTTDVIVGFPGEDADAFRASEELCRRAGFSRLHVFLFSPRPGTPAAAMKRTVPEREIEKWKTRLIRVGEELATAYARSCVGTEERVIVERGGAGLSDRYLKVKIQGRARQGEVVHVTITGEKKGELEGRRIQLVS